MSMFPPRRFIHASLSPLLTMILVVSSLSEHELRQQPQTINNIVAKKQIVLFALIIYLFIISIQCICKDGMLFKNVLGHSCRTIFVIACL